MSFDAWTLRVDNEEVTFEFSSECTLPIDPQRIAYFSAVLASARCQLQRVEGEYRSWKANQMSGVANVRRPKPIPEWKVKARVEAMAEHAQYIEAIAFARRNVAVLEALVWAMASTMAVAADRPPVWWPMSTDAQQIPVGRTG